MEQPADRSSPPAAAPAAPPAAQRASLLPACSWRWRFPAANIPIAAAVEDLDADSVAQLQGVDLQRWLTKTVKISEPQARLLVEKEELTGAVLLTAEPEQLERLLSHKIPLGPVLSILAKVKALQGERDVVLRASSVSSCWHAPPGATDLFDSSQACRRHRPLGRPAPARGARRRYAVLLPLASCSFGVSR